MIKLGSDSIDKVYLGNDQIFKLYLGNDLVFDSLNKVVFTTNSTSSTWTPALITNTGNTFTWTANGGGITEQILNVNLPTFNLSSNTGVVTITISSTDAFIGFTHLGLNNLAITGVNILRATNLIHIDFYQSSFISIDLSQNINLQDIWIQQSSLLNLDITLNTLTTYLAVNNNLLSTTDLDKIVNDLDANGLSNGTLTIANNSGSLSSNAYDGYNNLIFKNWTIDVGQPLSPSQPDVSSPLLVNFRVDDGDPNKVYFDSVDNLYGSTFTGFTISNNTISSIFIDSGSQFNHYFTVSSAFDFLKNSLIRYDGGSDLENVQNISLNPFTLQRIVNNIAEPTSSNQRYVSISGSGTHDGQSEANSWTLTEAINNVSNSTTVHCKAGDYGAGQWNFYSVPSTTANPIKFIGYKTTPNDISSNYYTYDSGSSLSTSEMPTMSGSSTGSVALIGFGANSGLVIKNFQTDNSSGKNGFDSSGANGILLENCNSRGCNRGINFYNGNNTIVRDCISVNHTLQGLQGSDSNSLYIDNEIYSNLTGGSTMDYYLTVQESLNSAYINNKSKRGLAGDGWEHGFSLAGETGSETEFNLVEGQYITGGAVSLECRRNGCSNNVIRYLHSDNTSIGIRLRDGAHDNIVEGLFSDNCTQGIDFTATSEPVGDGLQGSSYRNKVINSVVYNSTYSIYCKATVVGFPGDIEDNELINITFYNDTKTGKLIHEQETEGITYSGNTMKNCIIQNINSQGITTGWTFDYNDIYNSWATSVGTNSLNLDADFVSTNGFVPQEELIVSPKLLDYDINGKERANPSTIGAVLLVSENAGSIVPDYYVALSGNNSDGLTEATAWNNLATLNAQTFSAGETIGFKGGDEFQGKLDFININGSPGNLIEFTSYGTGMAIIGGSSPSNGFNLDGNCSYLKFSNIKFNNITDVNGADVYHRHGIYIGGSTFITVDSCIFDDIYKSGVSIESANNITVTNNLFNELNRGVGAIACGDNIKINHNQFLNPIDTRGESEPWGNFIGLDGCSGSGYELNDNIGEAVTGFNQVEDQINVYGCDGTVGSPIQIKRNKTRGGSSSISGGGIIGGDNNGSYIDIEDNILVNPRNYGVAIAGGTNITLRNNTIYNEQFTNSGEGIYIWAQSGGACSGHVMEDNTVESFYSNGDPASFWDGGNCTFTNVNNSFNDGIIDETILDTVILGAYLEAIRQTMLETEPPVIGVLSTDTITSSSVKLDWTAATDNVGVTNYEIYKDTILLETVGNVLTYTASGLSASTSYDFKIKAKDAAGNESSFSNTVSPTTTASETVLLEFDSTNTTSTAGTLTNVTGVSWTVVRSGTAYYYNGTNIVSAATNVARIQSTGVLIEGIRTNLIINSNSFSAGAWDISDASIVANAATSPDGTNNASKLRGTTSNTSHYLIAEAITSNQASFSVYAKKGEEDILSLGTATGASAGTFNLTTGVASANASGTASMTALANDWYLCSYIGDSGNFADWQYMSLRGNDLIYTGSNNTDGLYIWEAQIEDGDSTTSVIKTTGSTTQRNADVVTVTPPVGTVTIREWINNIEQTPITSIPGTFTMKNSTTKILMTE